MKIYNILLLLLVLFAVSCEDDDVTRPIAAFNVSETIVPVNKSVTFEYTGTGAKQVVIYPGDEGHDYELKSSGNTGFVVNKGIYTYSYKKAGVYKAVLVANNYDKEADNIVYETAEVTITVEDNRADLRSISLKKDIYNKELPGVIINDKILFAVPYKVRVSNRDVAVNVERQRLDILAISDAAAISLDGSEYIATTRYDLSQPLSVKVQSPAGDVKEYQTELLRYPIFEKFNINGVEGVVKYSDFDFDKVFIEVALPVGTGTTSLRPVFTSADAKTIEINGTLQESGVSTVDFSRPVIYTLKTWNGNNENTLFCESEIEVTVVLN